LSDPKRNGFVAAIAAQYGGRLRRFLGVRLRSSADAQDLAQEVFLRLLRVEHHEAIRSPEAYLFTVASHVIHQHALRERAVPRAMDIDDVLMELQAAAGDDPQRQAETEQRMESLRATLAKLPPQYSAALVLHRFAGLSIEEIGKELGVARPTAKKYLARALLHCRECQQGEE
jgi:RNA polymerase sigma factor (sigma-70 family)